MIGLAPFAYANLGIALHRNGEFAQAFASLKVARDMFKAQNHRAGEAYVVDALAQMYALDGRKAEAEKSWRYCLSLYEGMTSTMFADLRASGSKDVLEKLEQAGRAVMSATTVGTVIARGGQAAHAMSQERPPEQSQPSVFDVWSHSYEGLAARMSSASSDPTSVLSGDEPAQIARAHAAAMNMPSASATQIENSMTAQAGALSKSVDAVGERGGHAGHRRRHVRCADRRGADCSPPCCRPSRFRRCRRCASRTSISGCRTRIRIRRT